jgi:hypothetical protein
MVSVPCTFPSDVTPVVDFSVTPLTIIRIMTTGGSRKKHAVVADVTDMESFKQAARLRTIQWRRCVTCAAVVDRCLTLQQTVVLVNTDR